ncbi:hypothetical protein NC653_015480 [Populus alba x Populus x berolinensis]|uniref:Uncharacterized protein n=1 Tax=Populus alba x Populus x berolinensis TaxID=444605 RepID=A0AAD6VY97_9ROSI|nr:hypothetical protein NC653_015480 [Populus alba x Populus x berolinensis]
MKHFEIAGARMEFSLKEDLNESRPFLIDNQVETVKMNSRAWGSGTPAKKIKIKNIRVEMQGSFNALTMDGGVKRRKGRVTQADNYHMGIQYRTRDLMGKEKDPRSMPSRLSRTQRYAPFRVLGCVTYRVLG